MSSVVGNANILDVCHFIEDHCCHYSWWQCWVQGCPPCCWDTCHYSVSRVTCHVSPPPPLITHRHCRPGQKLQQTVKIGTFAITSATLMAKTTFSDISTFYTNPISSFFSPHNAVNGYSEVIEKNHLVFSVSLSCSDRWRWVRLGAGCWRLVTMWGRGLTSGLTPPMTGPRGTWWCTWAPHTRPPRTASTTADRWTNIFLKLNIFVGAAMLDKLWVVPTEINFCQKLLLLFIKQQGWILFHNSQETSNLFCKIMSPSYDTFR